MPPAVLLSCSCQKIQKILDKFTRCLWTPCRRIYPPAHCSPVQAAGEMLQSSILISWPGQYLPPGPGGGQSHLRLYCCNPGPHDVLQLPQRLHSHHWPCTSKNGWMRHHNKGFHKKMCLLQFSCHVAVKRSRQLLIYKPWIFSSQCRDKDGICLDRKWQ